LPPAVQRDAHSHIVCRCHMIRKRIIDDGQAAVEKLGTGLLFLRISKLQALEMEIDFHPLSLATSVGQKPSRREHTAALHASGWNDELQESTRKVQPAPVHTPSVINPHPGFPPPISTPRPPAWVCHGRKPAIPLSAFLMAPLPKCHPGSRSAASSGTSSPTSSVSSGSR
jgi:hypothetical protein